MLVRDRMSAHPVTIRSDADYKAALELMQEHDLHHVPVLDGQRIAVTEIPHDTRRHMIDLIETVPEGEYSGTGEAVAPWSRQVIQDHLRVCSGLLHPGTCSRGSHRAFAFSSGEGVFDTAERRVDIRDDVSVLHQREGGRPHIVRAEFIAARLERAAGRCEERVDGCPVIATHPT